MRPKPGALAKSCALWSLQDYLRDVRMANDRLGTSFVATPDILAAVIRRLADEDAVATPFLDVASRDRILEDVRELPYRQARPIVGEGERIVRQDFDICMSIPEAHPLQTLLGSVGEALEVALSSIRPRPLAHPLRFNDLVVQRYKRGSSGISPHRDHARYVDLVALMPIGGDGRFYVCKSRDGAGAREVAAGPGDLILMRAPGLYGRTDRPFHGLRDISAERYSVGLRRDQTREDKVGS